MKMAGATGRSNVGMTEQEVRVAMGKASIKTCWFIIAIAVALIFVVLGLCKIKEQGDNSIVVTITQLSRAEEDLRGYYEIYSKAKTERSRQMVINKIKKNYKGFNASFIADKKYRNFLINTRNN